MDIVLYMKDEDFKHKTGQLSSIDNEEGQITAFWSMGRAPKNFSVGDKIWIATMAVGLGIVRVRGYVVCEEFNPADLGGETIVWDSDTWTPSVHNKQILLSCKPFRGFRYRWWGREDE